MRLSYLLVKTSPDVNVWIIEDGCTDPTTFIRLTGREAQKEYISTNVEVKDFLISKDTLIITI